MGNENSKDGENAEQPEAEGPSASEDGAPSKLPNGDVGTSSSLKAGQAPEEQTPEDGEDGEDPREPSDVDEHTKRMTIIRENVYHYVGLVAGREYARERGLAPKDVGDLPAAPLGFLRPSDKKNEDATANGGKIPRKAGKEVDSPSMEMPRFYQSPGEDRNRTAENTGRNPDANDEGVAKDEEKDGKGKIGKMESKPDMELPRFYQTLDREKKPGQSSLKVDGKTQDEDNEEVVEKGENVQAVGGSGKSGLQSLPNGKAEEKTVQKPSKDALQSRPEKEANTPATKIPRFYQKPSDDKKKAGGELDTSETKDVTNGTRESKAQEKSDTVGEIDLPHFYHQSPGQNEAKTTGQPTDKSESRRMADGDTAAKNDRKNEKQENRPGQELEVALPRFYSADTNKEKIETESDSELHTTALTVGPRSRRTEEPERKGFVAKNVIFVGRTKRDENQTKPEDVEERTVKSEEVTSFQKAYRESLESANEPESYATESKSAERKEKVVRFDDCVAEKATAPPPTAERKRVISMMFVAPIRNARSEEPTVNAAPAVLTSIPPPTAEELSTKNDDDDVIYDEEKDDVIPICGEQLRQTHKSHRDIHGIMSAMFNPQDKQKPDIYNYDKYPTTESDHDDPDAVEDIVVPISASSLHSSSAIPSHSSLERIHDVEEGAQEYSVVHLKQPTPRSSQVDLGSGKILNAPSILMGSSITMSTNRQRCEVLPQENQDSDGQVSAVIAKSKTAPKEVRAEPSRRVVSLATGTASSLEDQVDSERASISDEVHASVEPLVTDEPDSGKGIRRDSCTQTADDAHETELTVAPPVVRSRSVGFQCGVGDQKRSIATAIQKRPSLPSVARPLRPSETEKKTRIPLTARTAQPVTKPVHSEVSVSPRSEPRSAQTEVRRSKGSPLPERKISVLRRDSSMNRSSPRTPPATNDHGSHKELGKRCSLPAAQNHSPACSTHPTTTRGVGSASPRIVRKRDDDGKSAMHKTSSSSKSMDSIPRCTCLQLSGKDGDKTPSSPTRHPTNPLGLRDYGFNPPSKKPIWR